MSTTSVPALLRQQVDRWAETWLKAKFSRLLELRAQDGPFNYPIAVFSEWRGNAFCLNVRYRARSRKPEDDFVVRHTRLTLAGFSRFDLAYFRHTDKWFTVYRGLTTADCFREIEENEIYERPLEHEAALRSLPIPTLLIWATRDPISPPAVGRHLARLLPIAKLIQLDDDSRLFARERPDEVAPLITAHLAQP